MRAFPTQGGDPGVILPACWRASPSTCCRVSCTRSLNFVEGFGFTGIAVALMGRNHRSASSSPACCSGAAPAQLRVRGGPQHRRGAAGSAILFCGALGTCCARASSRLLSGLCQPPGRPSERSLIMFEMLILMLDATIRTAPLLILPLWPGCFVNAPVNIALEGKSCWHPPSPVRRRPPSPVPPGLGWGSGWGSPSCSPCCTASPPSPTGVISGERHG